MGCIPCIAPAVPWLLIIAVCIIGLIGMMIWRGLAAIPFIVMGLYRYLSGARLIKDFGVKEKDMPPRRYARHVHAVARTAVPALAVLSLAYPIFFYGLSAVVTGTALAVGIEKARIWRDNRLAGRIAKDAIEGRPVRVKAEIGARP